MRTFLIAPSFMAMLSVAVFSVGWLISTGESTLSPNLGAMPERGSFAAWHETMPVKRPVFDTSLSTASEHAYELGSH